MKLRIELPKLREILEAETKALSVYAVGFALPSEDRGSFDASLGGSGTLVAIDGREGILTARHVIEELERRQNIGLILTSDPGDRFLHHPSFKFADCVSFVLPATGTAEEGPDLGFLSPPPAILDALRPRMSFFNLPYRREKLIDRRERLNEGLWILVGFADEWTRNGSPQKGYARVKAFRGMFCDGKVTREYEVADFDYLTFEVLYNGFYEGPESYAGFSGGGLWNILLKPEGEDVKVVDRLLSGVAFFQKAKTTVGDRTTREILCHGRRSIYKNLIDLVRSGGRATGR